MQASSEINHVPMTMAPSSLPLLSQMGKENAALVVLTPEIDPIWGFDSALIDLQLLAVASEFSLSSSILASHHPSTSNESSSAQVVVIRPLPSHTLTSVPLQGKHLISHLHRVLYKFASTFGREGTICTINTLLHLLPPAMVRFYHGEYVTPDGKCLFCMKSLT